jgi:hypothetical protein
MVPKRTIQKHRREIPDMILLCHSRVSAKCQL